MASRTLTDDEWEQIDAIDGWLFRDEADLLHSLNTGTWCEIGSWKGRSTFLLSRDHPGYAIDWFQGIADEQYELQDIDTFDEFAANIAPHRSNVAILPMPFRQAVRFVKGPIRLLFLDGEHNYEMTKQAFDLFSPFVEVGGHVVFHDAWGNDGSHEVTPFYEVTQFVLEVMDNPYWSHRPHLDASRCAVFRREFV